LENGGNTMDIDNSQLKTTISLHLFKFLIHETYSYEDVKVYYKDAYKYYIETFCAYSFMLRYYLSQKYPNSFDEIIHGVVLAYTNKLGEIIQSDVRIDMVSELEDYINKRYQEYLLSITNMNEPALVIVPMVLKSCLNRIPFANTNLFQRITNVIRQDSIESRDSVAFQYFISFESKLEKLLLDMQDELMLIEKITSHNNSNNENILFNTFLDNQTEINLAAFSLSEEITMKANECTNKLLKYIGLKNPGTDDFFNVLFDFILLLTHFCDRIAYQLLDENYRIAFIDALFYDVIEKTVDSYNNKLDEDSKTQLVERLIKAADEVNIRYGKCNNWFHENGKSPEGTLFYEFSKLLSHNINLPLDPDIMLIGIQLSSTAALELEVKQILEKYNLLK
jgi:hypothetical protein